MAASEQYSGPVGFTVGDRNDQRGPGSSTRTLGLAKTFSAQLGGRQPEVPRRRIQCAESSELRPYRMRMASMDTISEDILQGPDSARSASRVIRMET